MYEKAHSFGFKQGSQICQRLSDTVPYIMVQENHSTLCYIDDHLIFGQNKEKCQRAFDRLTALLQELGFTISQHRNVYPSTSAICLGILVNTEDFTMSVPSDKLKKIKEIIKNFKKTC